MIRAALKNPYAVVAISLIVVILGVVSYEHMEVDIFPEINIEKIGKPRGMDVTIVTTAKTDEEGRELLRLMSMPFRLR